MVKMRSDLDPLLRGRLISSISTTRYAQLPFEVASEGGVEGYRRKPGSSWRCNLLPYTLMKKVDELLEFE